MKLALGTVQFGMDYGVANTNGKTSDADIRKILKIASNSGINTLDTAVGYGDSEERLGKVGMDEWKIISKLPKLPEDTLDVRGWVENVVRGSLKRLNIRSLEAILLHQPMQLCGKSGNLIYSALENLVEDGLVKKIGISIYTPDELEMILPHFHFNVVQAPFNILDLRLIKSGWMKELSQLNIELHVRSVFLQGLLLMSSDYRLMRFGKWANLWNDWDTWINDLKISPLQACLSYVLSFDEISKVIVGVDNSTQLKDLLCATDIVPFDIPDSFKIDDPNLLNPALWTNAS